MDAAIWDAIGKALGQPLHRLWGGYRDTLPVITIGGYYGVREIADEVSELREQGLAGMKFKVGGRTPEEDAERFRTARATAGPDFVLCADANQGWTPSEAVRFARLVEDLDLHWFEEPCTWSNDRRAMRDVRYAGGVRVCAGQSEFSAGGCRDLMVDGAIDVCNFDSSWSGGPTEWRRVAAAAVSFDVAMAHHEEPQIASHLLASIPHGTFLEVFSPARDPIWWNLVANRPPIVDGLMVAPERTGSRLGARRRLHRCVPDHASPVTAPASPPRLGEGLAGNGVLVTGAVGGIGSAVAHAFAATGARVAALDREEAEARALATSLPGEGHIGIGADLADVARHDDLVADAEAAVGPLVALAHLAALLRRQADVRDVDERDWDAQTDVNLKATFFLDRAFAELLRSTGRPGAIVNFSSQGWWTGGFGGSVVYNATKGGIVTLTRGLARTYAPARIRVNAVAPGLVDTPMVRDDLPESVLRELVDQVPLGRLATPEEVAPAVVFLASDHAAYITGTTLNVSGGWLMY